MNDPNLFCQFNSHYAREARTWFVAVGRTNIQHEDQLLQIIICCSPADSGRALRTICRLIYTKSTRQGNRLKFSTCDRALENRPGYNFWLPRTTTFYCVINVCSSYVPFLVRGQQTTEAGEPIFRRCRLLIGMSAFVFSEGTKATLKRYCGRAIKSKSLTRGNVKQHIKLLTTLANGWLTVQRTGRENLVFNIRMMRATGLRYPNGEEILVVLEPEEQVMIRGFFRMMATTIKLFSDPTKTTSQPDTLGVLYDVQNYIRNHNIRLNVVPLSEELIQAFTGIIAMENERVREENQTQINLINCSMLQIEAIYKISTRRNATNCAEAVDSLVHHKRRYPNTNWDLIVLPPLPNAENFNPNAFYQPVAVRACPICDHPFDAVVEIVRHLVQEHLDRAWMNALYRYPRILQEDEEQQEDEPEDEEPEADQSDSD